MGAVVFGLQNIPDKFPVDRQMSELISVVIPTWNRKSELVSAVKSVLAQTMEVHEILVCDDGSDDSSLEAVNAFGDGRIKWMDGARSGGPAGPRNRGIGEASGDWIAFLDSDDHWLPTKLERQLIATREHRVKACCTNAWRVRPGQEISDRYLQSVPELLSTAELLRVNQVICSSALVHRSVLNQTGGFPEDEVVRAAEDYALWLRVSCITPFVYLSDPLVNYADDPGTSIRSGTNHAALMEAVMRDFYHWVDSHPAGVSRKGLARSALRKAMKKNGRSFWQRIQIR